MTHIQKSPGTKTVKAHVFSAANPTALPRKFKMALPTLQTIADNASIAFPASVFKASTSLFNHFFKLLLSFGKDIPEAAGLLFSSQDTCNSTSNWGSVHRKSIK